MPRERRALLLIAPVVGVLVSVVMTAVRYLVIEVLWARLQPAGPLAVILIPTAGLTLSGLLLQFASRNAEVHDTEAYIAAYHGDREAAASAPTKVLAAVATIGAGGAAGLEGPAVHAGSQIGRKLGSLVPGVGPLGGRRLLAAGAAAGVAAVFKTPLTGILFALEVPFKDELARGALIPSMLASVSSYLVAVSLTGPEPLFPVTRQYSPDTRALLLSVALGIVVGLAARFFSRLLRFARAMSERLAPPLTLRAAGGGFVVGLFGLASLYVLGAPLALGSGYEVIDLTVSGEIAGVQALWLSLLRSGSVLVTLASGAAGGSFFPLLSLGAAAGSVLDPLVPQSGSLFPLVGMAAFLSAGYGIPLTAAVFVAESTGAPGYVIPGLVGAAVAYVMTGRRSLSHLQRPGTAARMESQLSRPVSSVMTEDVIGVDPGTSVAAFIAEYVVAYRRKSFPVVDDGRLVGMIALEDVQSLPETKWAGMRVADLMETEVVTAMPGEAGAEVLERMESLDIDRIPVVRPEEPARLAGVVSLTDLQPKLRAVRA